MKIYIIDDCSDFPLWDKSRDLIFNLKEKMQAEVFHAMHQLSSIGSFTNVKIRKPNFQELPCIFAVTESANRRTVKELCNAKDLSAVERFFNELVKDHFSASKEEQEVFQIKNTRIEKAGVNGCCIDNLRGENAGPALVSIGMKRECPHCAQQFILIDEKPYNPYPKWVPYVKTKK